MARSERRILHMIIRDLRLCNEDAIKILGAEKLLGNVFSSPFYKRLFERDSSQYVDRMNCINTFLKEKGMTEEVFRNPEDYETSFADFQYFYPFKTTQQYIDEEAERCLVVKTNPEEPTEPVKTVFFGSYYQTDSDHKEPIEWIVLKQEKGKSLLLSKDCLDCRMYCESSSYANDWEESDLRPWLNGAFYDAAFSEEEKARILCNQDKVFLLSEFDATQYLKDQHISLKAKPTPYALENGAKTDHDGFAWWWLLWHQSNVSLPFVPSVGYRGSKGLRIESNRQGICVRPAIWLNK